LKNGGFAEGDEKKVAANWDIFANAIDAAFRAITDKDFKAAVHFLLNEPARKQNYENDLLGFTPLVLDPHQTEAQRTLLVVRTVRNNLEHGGKIQPEGEKQKGRNERLVASSLLVLQHAAGLNDKVGTQFHSSGT
jgi:hypothetical protein